MQRIHLLETCSCFLTLYANLFCYLLPICPWWRQLHPQARWRNSYWINPWHTTLVLIRLCDFHRWSVSPLQQNRSCGYERPSAGLTCDWRRFHLVCVHDAASLDDDAGDPTVLTWKADAHSHLTERSRVETAFYIIFILFRFGFLFFGNIRLTNSKTYESQTLWPVRPTVGPQDVTS